MNKKGNLDDLSDSLLTEIQRQRKYLKRLPKDFLYPLFNTKQALESQRQSGYRNTAAAAREIVDNAVEAGAKRVHILFDRVSERKGRGKGRETVSAIAFIDDGAGMLPEMARYALSWGGGTHFDDPSYLGKFGFGLPNASINQTRRVEVFTRTQPDESFSMTALDLDEVSTFGIQSVPPPKAADLPPFVQRYLDRNKFVLDHGTVVVWLNPDRLFYRTPEPLRRHLVDDFGVVYRYMFHYPGHTRPQGSHSVEPAERFELVVEGIKVGPVDPLFLDPHARLYVRPEDGGAELVEERTLPVKYYRDAESGALHLAKVTNSEDVEGEEVVAAGAINVRVARFPVGFVEARRGRRAEDDKLSDSNRRFEIRKERRGMSFVRADREIETVDAFPRRAADVAAGLGTWPLLQGYAYHWGIEVRFEPGLDEAFGITHDKQSVRPGEDFWRLLASEGIDRLLRNENQWQAKQRAKAPSLRAAGEEGAPSPAELSAQAADSTIGRRAWLPDREKEGAALRLQAEAQRRAELSEQSIRDVRRGLEEEAKRRPYKVDYVDDPHGPFFEPVWVGTQVVARINKQHPFFTTLYGSLLQLAGGRMVKEAIDLLILTLARSELTVDDDQAAEWYTMQREYTWSPYLATSMRTLAGLAMPAEEETEAAA